MIMVMAVQAAHITEKLLSARGRRKFILCVLS